MMSDGPAAVESAVVSARRTLIVSHVNPDGDAVGSCVALARIIQELGNDPRIFLQSGVPDFLSWLALPSPLVHTLAELGEWKPELLLFVDCGDMHRAGEEISAFMRGENARMPRKEIMAANIDHHASNLNFADVNWVDPECSATGELVGILAEKLGIPLAGELGEALYLTLVSDTGGFSYANTSADCLAMASRIVSLGLDVGRFTTKYENNWTLARMHLWGRLLSEISLHEQGSVVCSVVPKRYLQELGLNKDALEDYASWLRKLRGVRVALFVREDGPSRAKISLRSMGDVNVHEVAALFGGGGHAGAAGAELNLPPREAADLVLEALSFRAFTLELMARPDLADRSFRQGITLLSLHARGVLAALIFKDRLFGFLRLPFGPEFPGGPDGFAPALLLGILEDFRLGWLPREKVCTLGGYVWRPEELPAEAEGFVPLFAAGPLAQYMHGHARIL